AGLPRSPGEQVAAAGERRVEQAEVARDVRVGGAVHHPSEAQPTEREVDERRADTPFRAHAIRADAVAEPALEELALPGVRTLGVDPEPREVVVLVADPDTLEVDQE